MRVLIIANPLVGIHKGNRRIIEDIVDQITSRRGIADITYTMHPGTGKKRASRASLEGYDAVYAAGGDGTINDVASGLVGRSVPLGIIPLGSGNGFARSLGIPLDKKGFTDVLLQNKITTIDTGKIASRIFLSTAGMGYDANIAHDFNAQKISSRTSLKYFYYAVKNYFFKRSEHLKLIIDGKEINRTVFALTICNTMQYSSGAIIAPQAKPQSGELIAVLIPKLPLYKAPLAAIKLFNGSVKDIKELEYIPFKNLTIKRRKAGLVHVDGENFRGEKTLNTSVEPSSLKIIAP
ncbi:diacylglycerol/lipid kinase family protein [Candidatus Latescibacterota bacterium]